MSKQWFILSTFAGQEQNVQKQLVAWSKSDAEWHEYIGDVALPKIKEENSTRPVFPGYVFAELDIFSNFSKGEKRKELWNAICKLDGMIGFLGGESPHPMSEDELASLKEISSEKTNKKTVDFKVGDLVNVIDGAFANNTGTIVKVANDTVTIKVEIFGEETEQEVPIGSVSIADKE